MKPIFHDDFSVGEGMNCPYSWEVERHSDLPHAHAVVQEGRYLLMAPGNRYLPTVPALRDFELDLDFHSKLHVGGGRRDLKVCFRHDRQTRSGGFVGVSWDNGKVQAVLGRAAGNVHSVRQSLELDGIPCLDAGTLRVKVVGDTFALELDGAALAKFESADFPGPGAVAIARGRFSGPLALRQVSLASDDKIARTPLGKPVTLAFPEDTDGMVVPIRCRVEAFRVGGTVELHAELAGGVLEKPDTTPWFRYHCFEIDALTRPYLRVDGRTFRLDEGTLVLACPKEHDTAFYGDIYQKPTWPLKRVFHLAGLSENAVFCLGYEHYCNEAARHLQGGPTEVGPGKALNREGFAVTLRSGADKRIRRLLPKDGPRHGKAVVFAQKNHYFLASEPCRFTVDVAWRRDDLAPGELRLEWRRESAFLEPATTFEPVILEGGSAQLPPLEGLPVGVHHLRVRLSLGGQAVHESVTAFEVMPESSGASPAPLASGLPFLFSMPNEIKALETDTFDPWANATADAGHYMSACCFYPDVARRGRTWEVTALYRRQWFLWLTSRTSEDWSVEANRDVIARCDFLNIPSSNSESSRYEPWKSTAYRGEMLTVLKRFLEDRRLAPDDPLHPDKLAAMESLPYPCFESLFQRFWTQWLDFFCQWQAGSKTRQLLALREINPAVRRSDYGPYPIYASHYKGSRCLKHLGMDPKLGIEAYHDGFFVLEDYPLISKYSVHRGAFHLTAVKLAAPKLRIYPEIYGPSLQPCPDSALAFALPPYGYFNDCPLETVTQRLFEFAFACAWHDGQAFHYWSDDGFHCRNWELPRFHTLLRAWGAVRAARPARPARGTAFVVAPELVDQVPDCLDAPPEGACCPWADVFNVAEETPAFLYETAREDGQQAGFLASLESLRTLTAADVDMVALPPMGHAPEDIRAAVRRLFAAGVNLLGTMDVTGLEDLFGVAPLEAPIAVHHISVRPGAADGLLGELSGMTEFTEHPAALGRYRADGAEVLLDAEAPVLLCRREGGRFAALFNVPPTVIRRDDFQERVGYGRQSVSELVNRAAALLTRRLGNPVVETTAGKPIAFHDQSGDLRVVVMNDAFAAAPAPIQPLVTICAAGEVEATCPFSVIAANADALKIRLFLKERESAIITIKGVKPS